MSWQNNGGRPRRPGDTGPELEALIQKGQQQIRKVIPGGGSRGPASFIIILLLIALAWSAFYTVPSDSVAVIQRFGKYVKEVPPGLHFKFPFGIG